VIRQQPGSTESIGQETDHECEQKSAEAGASSLRLPRETRGRKKGNAHEAQTARASRAKPGPGNNQALGLRRDGCFAAAAGFLAPDTTTAPEPLPAPPSASTSSGVSSVPEASASRSVRVTGAVKVI